MTWEIMVGIIALVGFCITLGTPILKLNTSIIRLNESVNVLRDAITKSEVDNKEAHKRIWDHMDDVDETIKDHEDRLVKAESVLQHQHDKLVKIETETAGQEHRITVMETEIIQHGKDIKDSIDKIEKYR